MKTRAKRLHNRAASFVKKTAPILGSGNAGNPAKGLYLVKDALGACAFRAYRFVFGKKRKIEGG